MMASADPQARPEIEFRVYSPQADSNPIMSGQESTFRRPWMCVFCAPPAAGRPRLRALKATPV